LLSGIAGRPSLESELHISQTDVFRNINFY
jgi:hypothetical protein